MAQGKRDQLSELDLMESGTTAVTAGDAIPIGYFQVPEGLEYELGFGSLEGQHSAPGRIYAEIKDDADEEVDGDVIFQALNPQKEHRANIEVFRTTSLNTDLSARTEQLPFSRIPGRVTEGAYISVAFRADDDATLDRDNCTILLDATRYDTR